MIITHKRLFTGLAHFLRRYDKKLAGELSVARTRFDSFGNILVRLHGSKSTQSRKRTKI